MRGRILVVFGPEGDLRKAVMNEPLYRPLKAVKEGRVIYLDRNDVLNGALSFGTPLSLPYALDEMVPRLSAALDGDLGTKVEETT